MMPHWIRAQHWMTMPASAALLKRALKILSVLLALLTGYLLYAWRHTSLAAADARAAVKQHEADLQEARNAIAQAGPEARHELSGSAAVSRLQSAFETHALLAGADLAEFEASSQFTPFLSRFTKVAEQTDWLQVSVKAKLQGDVRAVMATLDALAQEDIPFEFDSLEITRVGFAAGERPIVEAAVDMRVLTRPEGA